jgi:hypothetical protein
MTYIQIFNRRKTDGELWARVEVALVKYAVYCKNATLNTEWWQRVITAPGPIVEAMRWELVFDPAISTAEDTSTITDQDISGAVEAICLRY